MCICMCVFVYLYVHMCICMCICVFVCAYLCMSELVLLFNMGVYVLATVITSARLDAEFSRILTFILLFAEPRRR